MGCGGINGKMYATQSVTLLSETQSVSCVGIATQRGQWLASRAAYPNTKYSLAEIENLPTSQLTPVTLLEPAPAPMISPPGSPTSAASSARSYVYRGGGRGGGGYSGKGQ